VGWWSLLNRFRPQRRRGKPRTASPHETSPRRKCRFEQMEDRRLLNADPIRVGVTYLETDSGSDRTGIASRCSSREERPGRS
jgi:hypothetical protein